MGLKKNGSTLKQMAYARRLWGAEGKNRSLIARDVGYSPGTALSVGTAVEQSVGFHNAVAQLSVESNSLALAIMHEFKARGVEDFSNKDLIGALNAIGGAWARFNGALTKERDMDGPNTRHGMNKLRTVVLQQVENQTVQIVERMPTEDELNF